MSRQVTLAPPRPLIVVVTTLSALVTITLFSWGAVSDETLSSHLTYGTVNAFICVLAGLVLSSRIYAQGEMLYVVNVVTVTAVPREAIAEVNGRNGVYVLTWQGEEVEYLAYGSSVLQIFFPSRRYRRVAEDMWIWAAGGAHSEPSHRGVTRRPRKAVLVGSLVSLALWLPLGRLAYEHNDTLLRMLASL
ncbi:hypothetical protein ACFFGJ_14095 [Cellulomonas phragmiteti]|uniref:PH domain-containing protein n=1 Tax=Cellulomonas phragmiteti TaxID=478780 RepID=A0ABQ4DRF5_9CELL|nr:hypothetical protein Cph01nite_36950 [Cellulomonas phragmiteti]